ncbi:RagB/SusD family nutrient uptake outer membrane protein [Pollutibacter soli]|uniref:RagB/SusD family nutrient uptake outer membrane protein n=1 Tax=Pollutibacter soli TaxID=3034157 RepID=UPI003014110D
MKRNNQFQIFIIFLFVWCGSACNKMDETVYSNVMVDNYYKSAGDAEAALVAAYAPLADLYSLSANLISADFQDDQTWAKPVVGRNVYPLFTYDPDYSAQKSFGRELEGPYGVWRYCYKGIENANWVLEKVPAIDMDPVRKDAILGEALFLRGYYYFTLGRAFGDVVLRTTVSRKETDTYVPKSSQAEVFGQVMADVQSAASKLPSYGVATVKGRPTKEAAIALHAKTALYAENWQLAKEKALEVINSGKYALLPNVVDLYDVNKEDLARLEVMFAFEGDNGNISEYSNMMGLCGPANSAGRDYGNSTFGSIFAYQVFFDSFNPSDERRLMLDTFFVNRAGVVVHQKDIIPFSPNAVLIKKYMDKNSNGARCRNNVPILRLADMYLIVAEAEARLNGPTLLAYQNINIVRSRASIPDLDPLLNKEQFIEAVLQERGWEFFAEGDRWYDLTRTNTFMTKIPLAVDVVYPVRTPQPKHRYFPIPLDEIRANPVLEQNPAWN